MQNLKARLGKVCLSLVRGGMGLDLRLTVLVGKELDEKVMQPDESESE